MPPARRAALTYIVYFTAVGAGFPYLPVFYRGLGLDLGAIGVVSAVFAGCQMIGAPAWGALADRWPRSRLTLPAAALLSAVAGLSLGLSRDIPQVVISAAVLALGLGGIGPILDARTLDILGADRIRYGQLRAWGSVAFVVTALVVGGLIDARGDPALFLVYVPALVVTGLIAASLPRRPTTRSVSILRGAWVLILGPGMRTFLGGSLLVWTTLNAVNSFYSIQIVGLGAPAATVGIAWAAGAVVEVPIMFGYPRLAARFGTGRLLVAGAAAFAVRGFLAATATDPTTLVLIAPIEGLAFGLFFVSGVNFVAQRAPRGLAATAQGVYTTTSGLGAILGAGLGGIVAGSLSIPGLFAVASAAGVLAAGVLALAVGSSPAPAIEEPSAVGIGDSGAS